MKKLNRIYRSVVGELAMWWMWIKNICFVFLTNKSKVRAFTGYGHWWLAKKYADRRTGISRVNTYCGGKRHYVLAYGERSLIVLNSLELHEMKKRGVFNKHLNINTVLKHAYYVTK